MQGFSGSGFENNWMEPVHGVDKNAHVANQLITYEAYTSTYSMNSYVNGAAYNGRSRYTLCEIAQ